MKIQRTAKDWHLEIRNENDFLFYFSFLWTFRPEYYFSNVIRARRRCYTAGMHSSQLTRLSRKRFSILPTLSSTKPVRWPLVSSMWRDRNTQFHLCETNYAIAIELLRQATCRNEIKKKEGMEVKGSPRLSHPQKKGV